MIRVALILVLVMGMASCSYMPPKGPPWAGFVLLLVVVVACIWNIVKGDEDDEDDGV